MSYVSLDKNSDIILLEQQIDGGMTSPIGELLFSFLDLDLREYGDLYHLISYENDFNYNDFKDLCLTYPKTYTEMSKHRRGFPTESSDDDTLRSFAAYFLTENKDTFSDLYEHPFFSFSTSMEAAWYLDYAEIHDQIDFFHFQELFKNLVDFCFLNDDPKLSRLDKESRFFLFSACTPRFRFLFNTKNAFLPYPYSLYSKIEGLAAESLSKLNIGNYKALDILPLLSDSIIDEVSDRSRLLSVGSCNTVFDFLVFEFEAILFKGLDIKRCANCGKLFIPSGKYDTDCCDRIPEGEKYSCKKIMAQKRRKQKVNSDPITKEYEKAYKRMYARISSGTLEKSDFLKWSEDAKQKRDTASQRYSKSKDEKILIDFKKYLENK